MNKRKNRIVTLALLVVLSFTTVCFASPGPPMESDYCQHLSTPVIIAPYNSVSCGYLLNLFQQQNTYRNDIITQENLLRSYAKQLKSLQNVYGWSIAGAMADTVTVCVSTIGVPLCLGGLAAVDAAAAASFVTNISGIYSSKTQIILVKTKAITAGQNLQTATSQYNAVTSKIQSHVAAQGEQCFKCSVVVSPTPTVNWPIVKPVY